MFGDTITITINSVAKVLNKINQDGYSGEYLLRGTDDEFRLRIKHSSYTDKGRGKVIDRHTVELVQTIYPDGDTPSVVRKSYQVLENEHTDVDATVTDFAVGFDAFFTSTNIGKLLSWNS